MSKDEVKLDSKKKSRADLLLEHSIGKYNAVVIVHLDKDGAIGCDGDGNLSRTETLWLLEKAKLRLLDGEW